MRPAQFIFSAADRDGIAAAQTTAGAVALALNGALALPRQPWNSGPVGFMGAGVNRTLSLYSTGNLSGINFTIVGLDASGNAVTEVLAGPNNTTVYSVNLYNTILSVTPNGAVATAVEAGSGTTGATNWYAVDYYLDPANIGLWLKISGTISVTVQLTPDAFLQTTTAPSTFNHAYLTTVTADAASALTYPAQGIRMLVGSSTVDSGAAIFTIIQAGIGLNQ
jgi:hypothetical protein